MNEDLNDIAEPSVNTGLEAPHFDEEATLLSARPVVPLKIVEADGKRQRFLFAVALLVAMLAGAAGAAFVYSQGSNASTIESTATETDQTTPVNSLNQSIEETRQELAGAEDETNQVASPESSQKEVRAVVSPKRTEPPSRQTNESDETQPRAVREETRARRVSDSREQDSEELREARREARRESRREQRAAQRRGRDGGDLFRIRDIFEGSPTP